jgi:hypothetical protein
MVVQDKSQEQISQTIEPASQHEKDNTIISRLARVMQNYSELAELIAS